MKIWVDAQLSPAIAAWIGRSFPEIQASSVRALGLRDATAAAVQKAFEAVDDEALGEQWVLRHGENVIMKQSRVGVLRSACISHLIHHRGQLSVYLRLLDIPVPSIYGPSADER